MHALLHRLRASQALSTTRFELARLQQHAHHATVWLSELSLERARLASDLVRLEEERSRAEGTRARFVLDLVLRWDEERRDECRAVERALGALVV